LIFKAPQPPGLNIELAGLQSSFNGLTQFKPFNRYQNGSLFKTFQSFNPPDVVRGLFKPLSGDRDSKFEHSVRRAVSDVIPQEHTAHHRTGSRKNTIGVEKSRFGHP
jgi:hypothetical protein